MAFTEKQNAIIAVSIIFPVMASIMVGLRLRARVITRERIKADDYWGVAATVIIVANMIPFLVGASRFCVGVHQSLCSPDQIIHFAKIVFVIQFLYLGSISFVKISLVLFFKRIFTSKGFARASNAVIVLVSLWSISFFFATLFQIWPISQNWSLGGTPSWVTNEQAMYTWLAGTDIFADVVTLALPVPMILNLRMSGKDKVAFAGIFGLGVLTIVASVMRLIYVLLFIRHVDSDKTYLLADVIIWSAIEPAGYHFPEEQSIPTNLLAPTMF